MSVVGMGSWDEALPSMLYGAEVMQGLAILVKVPWNLAVVANVASALSHEAGCV
jgi:hypothetical protein